MEKRMSTEGFFFANNADDMEIGDSGFVSRSDGWMENKYNGFIRDPEGRIYDNEGDLVWDPFDMDEEFDEEEYEFYHD